MFDYFYFRLFNYYAKAYTRLGCSWDDDYFSYHACWELSLLQSALIWCIMMSLRIFKFFNYIFTDVGAPIIFGAWFVFMIIFLPRINKKRYKDKISELSQKYENYSANKWFKNWMFLILLFLFVFFPFILSNFLRWVIG